MKKKIYLAGPDVFRENPIEHFNKLKELCSEYGFEGLSPFDNENFDGELFSKAHSTNVFLSNVNLIVEKCDIIVANLTQFRGACVDDGTAWEIGCGYAHKRLMYGYTSEFNIPMPLQYLLHNISSEFPNVESFANNCVNLMLQESIELSGGKILASFEDCLIDGTQRILINHQNKF
jgi:nucleoside 2-deoxyribosyltransferase